ncbi:MAG: histidine kinase [Ignavibacteria bacterium]|nr:MAG: histidine kinase [Ignavibacteria bacterium]
MSRYRNDIRNYRGISLYRDRILVLPKSDTARDWLGIDLRRVSKVGTRLSTNQIVGYISISAEKNKKIKETSDRERLEENKAFKDFKKLISKILSILENERDKVRKNTSHKEPALTDLFSQLSTAPLMESIYSAMKKGARTTEIINLVEDYGNQVEKTVEIIENRLYYYSRLASLGILAAILVHEVRNQTLIIDGFLRLMKKTLSKIEIDEKAQIETELQLAEKGLSSLDILANRFAPLARRTSSNRKKSSIIEEIISDSVQMRMQEIKQKNIQISIPSTKTEALIDPGELTAVFINLIDNSIYWLGFREILDRSLEFSIKINKVNKRVTVQANDNGPGITPGDEERIFWPGVTRKENGFGMGLTVASEIISQYGGKMSLVVPGFLNGASFQFDLPWSDSGSKNE